MLMRRTAIVRDLAVFERQFLYTRECLSADRGALYQKSRTFLRHCVVGSGGNGVSADRRYSMRCSGLLDRKSVHRGFGGELLVRAEWSCDCPRPPETFCMHCTVLLLVITRTRTRTSEKSPDHASCSCCIVILSVESLLVQFVSRQPCRQPSHSPCHGLLVLEMWCHMTHFRLVQLTT